MSTTTVERPTKNTTDVWFGHTFLGTIIKVPSERRGSIRWQAQTPSGKVAAWPRTKAEAADWLREQEINRLITVGREDLEASLRRKISAEAVENVDTSVLLEELRRRMDADPAQFNDEGPTKRYTSRFIDTLSNTIPFTPSQLKDTIETRLHQTGKDSAEDAKGEAYDIVSDVLTYVSEDVSGYVNARLDESEREELLAPYRADDELRTEISYAMRAKSDPERLGQLTKIINVYLRENNFGTGHALLL